MKKAITPVISIIILLLITVSLSGMGWTYMSGYYEAMTAKQIQIVMGSAYGNEVMIQNTGTSEITKDDLNILVDGKESGIVRMIPSTVKPRESARLVFEFAGLGDSNVRIIGPGNSINFNHDIKVDELDGLLLWWKFDEGSGTTAMDSSGNGNDGTLAGGAGWAEGKIGKALDISSTNQYAEKDWQDFTFSESTTEFWVKANVVSTGWRDIVSISGTEHSRFHLYATNNSIVWYDIYDTCGTLFSGIIPVVDQWYHVVGTHDGTTARIYVDGDFKNSLPCTDTETSISIKAGTQTELFDGQIDEVRAWSRALSENEIKALHSLS